MTNQAIDLSTRQTAPTSGATIKRIVPRVGNIILTVAAFAGALCIAALIAAQFFQISIILFSTGSMSPTMPTGSIALVRQIPAEQARVGQVVTVDRPQELPITHRIVSTTQLPDGRTELVLRGDANKNDDPAPYSVTSVRLVIASVPWGAQVIAFLSTPLFLVPATGAAVVLVAWAFWPRTSSGRSRQHAVAAEATVIASTSDELRRPRSHRTQPQHKTLRDDKSSSHAAIHSRRSK